MFCHTGKEMRWMITKKKWNGSFKESQYIETGNLVGDVIENGGRLLHEATTDGYTHEIVERGQYISEDYYFPRNIPGKKPHIHYEMRSNGDVLIDGKSLIHKTGDDNMIRGKVLSKGRNLGRRGEIECKELKDEAEERIEKSDKLNELGLRFESDKAKLEAEIDKVNASSISQKDKAAIISQLNAAILVLQEEYEEAVVQEEERIYDEIQEQIEQMGEAVDELEQQADSLRDIRMEASSTDASAAVDAAEAKKQEFEQMKAEYAEKLKMQMDRAEIQYRNIRVRKLSGK